MRFRMGARRVGVFFSALTGIVFYGAWMLLAFAVLPLILIVTRIFRDHVRESYRRVRAAIARINSFTQEHIVGMSVVQGSRYRLQELRGFAWRQATVGHSLGQITAVHIFQHQKGPLRMLADVKNLHDVGML